jgi:hypothetical protein
LVGAARHSDVTLLAELLAEKGINNVNKSGAGLIESLGKWQNFPIVFGWAQE